MKTRRGIREIQYIYYECSWAYVFRLDTRKHELLNTIAKIGNYRRFADKKSIETTQR